MDYWIGRENKEYLKVRGRGFRFIVLIFVCCVWKDEVKGLGL